mmetsp:Transcript_120798/g.327803  ORF Transcript_120798/g.327803 Transcript_120798/m.327803 type:complete len:93 (+) Transcript_120798:153-431(+)
MGSPGITVATGTGTGAPTLAGGEAVVIMLGDIKPDGSGCGTAAVKLALPGVMSLEYDCAARPSGETDLITCVTWASVCRMPRTSSNLLCASL